MQRPLRASGVRWLGALLPAAFTLLEHPGLVGGLLPVAAWHDPQPAATDDID